MNFNALKIHKKISEIQGLCSKMTKLDIEEGVKSQ